MRLLFILLNALCRPFPVINFLLLLLDSLQAISDFYLIYMEWYMGNYIRPLSDVVFSIASWITCDRRFRDPTIIYDG